MRDESRAVELMGREPINPIGECFESAAFQFMMGNEDLPNSTVICHGIGTSNFPGEEGRKIGHAWLEAPHPEAGAVAMDTTWGVTTDAKSYRENLKLEYVVQYSWMEFYKLWKLHNYPGPFDLKIKEITDACKASQLDG